MEKILYVVAVIIGIIGFCYEWCRYPYTLSKWKRNRMSDIEFYEERLIHSISMFIVWGGFIALLVYSCHNEL